MKRGVPKTAENCPKPETPRGTPGPVGNQPKTATVPLSQALGVGTVGHWGKQQFEMSEYAKPHGDERGTTERSTTMANNVDVSLTVMGDDREITLNNGERMTVREYLAIRKEEGLKIDPSTAEVEWWYVQELDPYGVDPELPDDCRCVNRGYFARRPGSDIWVEFGDLPEKTRDALTNVKPSLDADADVPPF